MADEATDPGTPAAPEQEPAPAPAEGAERGTNPGPYLDSADIGKRGRITVEDNHRLDAFARRPTPTATPTAGAASRSADERARGLSGLNKRPHRGRRQQQADRQAHEPPLAEVEQQQDD